MFFDLAGAGELGGGAFFDFEFGGGDLLFLGGGGGVEGAPAEGEQLLF